MIRPLLSAHSSLDDVERTGNMIATDDGMHRALATDYDEQRDRRLAELRTRWWDDGTDV